MRRTRFDFAGPIRVVTDRHTPAQIAQLRQDGLTAVRTKDGFLRVQGRIMREGVLDYSDGRDTWGEFRSRDEIEKSLDSFRLSVVTLNHPKDLVTVDNVADLQVGHLGSRLGWDPELPDHILADFLITGQAALDAIDAGTAELSVGFTAMVREQTGVDSQGRTYRFVQEQIEGNHVAIVPEGRAGRDARLLLDAANGAAYSVATSTHSKGRQDVDEEEIEIDGKTVTVPKAAADLIRTMQAKLEADPEEEKPEDGEEEEEKEEEEEAKKDSSTILALKARCDRQEAELAQLKADAAKRRRDELIACARNVGVKIDTKTVKTDADIMRAVVLTRMPALESRLDEHASEPGYLKALFDDVIDTAGRERSRTITTAVHRAVADSTGGDADFFQRLDEWVLPAKTVNGGV